jgi:hypothetical protein
MNWTEMPHWVVMTMEGPGEERCAGHHPTRRYAGEQRERVRASAWRRRAWIRPTAGDTEEQALETERAYIKAESAD